MTDVVGFTTKRASVRSLQRSGRWSRLCLKELRETLRDRRTLITLFLMPLLVYPVLSMVFQRSLISVWSSQEQKLLIGVKSKETAELLRANLLLGDRYLRNGRRVSPLEPSPPSTAVRSESVAPPDRPPQPFAIGGLLESSDYRVEQISFLQGDDLRAMVEAERVDLAIVTDGEGKRTRLELIHREGSPLSTRALRFVEQRLDAANELILRKRLRESGRSSQLVLKRTRLPIESVQKDATLSTIVPMILILMTVTGAVYPAIDLTAGERERGTLEMLMASPVSRLKLLMAKYVAVVMVAFLTALVNLLAMTVTLQATGLGRVLFGESGLNPVRVAQILVLLVLFAAFFSAVLLALTSFARSFKEAQAYLIPLMLLSLGPGIVSLLPGLELRGILVVTPVSNMVLLARDLCGDGLNPFMASVALASTMLYTLAAIGVAAKIFGADAVMSGGRTELRSVFSPQNGASSDVASVSAALLCLAVVFPVYFITSSALGQLSELAIPVRLALSGIATSLLFGVVPWIASRLQKIRLSSAFGIRPASAAAFPVAVLLGCTLWPLAHEIVLLTQALGLGTIRPEQFTAAENLIAELRTVSPGLILLCMAVAPAVFEELFFRGYLFNALRATVSGSRTILISAVLFGLFHVFSNSALSVERLFPSAFLGLVLGFLSYHSGSVLPGIVLHACHNGSLMLMAYYREELAARGFGIEEQSHMPPSWIAASIGALLVGVVWIAVLPKRKAALH